ncbi:MAG: hypothetical protein ACFCD0_19465 [Gemmataceae bacterium]
MRRETVVLIVANCPDEKLCRESLAFRHFKGRNYTALMRDLMLSQMMLTFVADQTLEGKNCAEIRETKLRLAGYVELGLGTRNF